MRSGGPWGTGGEGRQDLGGRTPAVGGAGPCAGALWTNRPSPDCWPRCHPGGRALRLLSLGVRQNNEDLMKTGEEKAEAPGPGRSQVQEEESREGEGQRCGEQEKDPLQPLPGHMQEEQKREGGRAQ